jgi:hypothetical protein
MNFEKDAVPATCAGTGAAAAEEDREAGMERAVVPGRSVKAGPLSMRLFAPSPGAQATM